MNNRIEALYVPNPDQTRTRVQSLQVEGGLKLERDLSSVGDVVSEYKPKFDAAFGVTRQTDRGERAYLTAMSALELRRMFFNPLIFRSLPITASHTEAIWREMDTGHGLNINFPSRYRGQRKVLEGVAGELAVYSELGLKSVAEETIASFEGQMDGFNNAFSLQTNVMNEAIEEYLGIEYPGWDSDKKRRKNPTKYKEAMSTDEYFWLRKLHTSGSDIRKSFTAASTATAGFIADRFDDLWISARLAGVPEDERMRLAYRKNRMLAIQSQLPDGQSLFFDDPGYENPYMVFQTSDGTWDADISDEYGYLKKVYHDPKHRYKGCQGAGEVSLLDSEMQLSMERLLVKLAHRSGSQSLDIDSGHATSATQRFSLLALALNDYLLNYTNN